MAKRVRKRPRSDPRRRRNGTTLSGQTLGMSLKGACWFTALAVVVFCLNGLYTLAEYYRTGHVLVQVSVSAVACTMVAASAWIWLQRWKSGRRKPVPKTQPSRP